jgi:hypothetical protein
MAEGRHEASGVTPAGATDLVNPFPIIIAKLNQILAKLSTSGGGAGNHTLRWDTNNASATRFTVLAAIPGAVLDNNTGLVWEQAPDGTPRKWRNLTASHLGATNYYVNKNVGGTVGWRLPSVVELKSVQDGSPTAEAPFVPASAFTLSTSDSTPGVQPNDYWSAASAENPSNAWYVDFGHGFVGFNDKALLSFHTWCVRGGMHADAY